LRQQAERLESLAQGVVDLARLDSSRGINRWHPFSLNTLLTNALSKHESLIKQRKLQMTIIQPQPSLPDLNGDPEQVQQAIAELIKNAITFSSEEGFIRIEVTQTLKKTKQWATIAVTDEGPGITPIEQEKVFDRFFRGTAVSQKTIPGLGLGLSFVWEIIQAHGGRITVSSEENQGSTFTIWLPIPER
jgi:two-component system sensor histidine kinase SenX3